MTLIHYICSATNMFTHTHIETENDEDFIFPHLPPLSLHMCLPSSTSLPLSISLPCLSCPLYPPYLVFSPSHFSLAISFHPKGAGFKQRLKHYWTHIALNLCDRTANVENAKHKVFISGWSSALRLYFPLIFHIFSLDPILTNSYTQL